MSAFVVDRCHIDVLVALGVHGPTGVPIQPAWWTGPSWFKDDPRAVPSPTIRRLHTADADGQSPDRVTPSGLGTLLIEECVKSVSHRYPGNRALPGPNEPYWTEPYTYRRPGYVPTVVEGLKAIDCYEYQSCEHLGWRDSEASRYCDSLRSNLIGVLEGYDEAPWGWNSRHIDVCRAKHLTRS